MSILLRKPHSKFLFLYRRRIVFWGLRSEKKTLRVHSLGLGFRINRPAKYLLCLYHLNVLISHLQKTWWKKWRALRDTTKYPQPNYRFFPRSRKSTQTFMQLKIFARTSYQKDTPKYTRRCLPRKASGRF